MIWAQSEKPLVDCEGSLIQKADCPGLSRTLVYASRRWVNHGERLLAQFSHDTDVPIWHFRNVVFSRGSEDSRNAWSGELVVICYPSCQI